MRLLVHQVWFISLFYCPLLCLLTYNELSCHSNNCKQKHTVDRKTRHMEHGHRYLKTTLYVINCAHYCIKLRLTISAPG